MYCIKCGTKNLDDANFCIKCGNTLKLEKSTLSKPENKPDEEKIKVSKFLGPVFTRAQYPFSDNS